MRLSLPFSELTSMVRKMDATPVGWVSGADNLDEVDIAEILLKGIEIAIEDVEVTDDGLLAYQGEQVLLYIKDTMKDKHTLLYEVDNAPRFHVADCRALDRMRSQKRFDRYVVTNNTSGNFNVEYFEWDTNDRGETVSRLKACKDCLRHLNYGGYKGASQGKKSEIWNSFSIEYFFEIYKSHFKQKPAYTDKTAPKGGYADNWSDISDRFRTSVGWKCQNCGVDLSGSGKKNLLHAHHANGVKSDNSPGNLKALCVLCHGEQPQHGHMHIKPKDKVAIISLRREQRKSPKLSSNIPKENLSSRPSKKKRAATKKTGSLTRKKARTELIKLREQIWKEMPDIDHAEGVLRKNMLRHFLEDQVISKDEYLKKIPTHERQRTDSRQLQYLSQIFNIILRIKGLAGQGEKKSIRP